MPRGEQRLDGQLVAYMEMGVFLERFGAGEIHRLQLARPHLGPRTSRRQRRQRGNVVVMRMGDKNMPHIQVLGLDRIDERLGVGAGVKHRGEARARVPDQIVVHRLFALRGVEEGQAARKNRCGRVKPFVGERLQRVGAQLQVAGDAADDRGVALPSLALF